MKLSKFLWDRKFTILLLIMALITSEILLIIYQFGMFIKIYIPIAVLMLYFLGIFLEYLKEKKFYEGILNQLEELDQKYLIREIIDEPNFEEGRILTRILEETDKAMIEKVKEYKLSAEEYKEYIELWIHEVKLPIAAGKLVIENNKNEVTKSIYEEFDKIEDYIEQALFYARSNTVEKDYFLKKTKLEEIINMTLRKNKTQFISNKVSVELQNIDQEVYTDNKWCVFILNQILANSIQYSKPDQKIIWMSAKEEKEKVILEIKDNGIGMKENEQKRVFEKGFTGTNGRIEGKRSTGIGLYLCKKLCDKLGMGIIFSSEIGKGTTVKLIFPKNSYVIMKESKD